MKRSWKDWLLRNYHWVIFGAVFIEYTVSIGLANNIYSLFIIPVTQTFGITRGTFSIASSIKYIAAFCSNLTFGLLYRRWGYRTMTTLALVMSTVAYAGYALSGNIVPFYLGAVLVGISESFFSTAGTSRIITDWFHRHQGTVLGIVMAASGLGGTVFSVGLSEVMEHSGWRSAMWISAGLLLFSAVLIGLLVRDAPAWMGLQPYGDAEDREHARKQRGKRHAHHESAWAGFGFARLRKRPCFYLAVAAALLMGIANYGISGQLVAYWQDCGMTATAAASAQGIMYLVLAVEKVVLGVICDRFGARAGMMLCMGCNLGGMLLLQTLPGYGGAVAGATVFAVGLCCTSIMLPVLTSDLFGQADYATVLGILLAMLSLSGAVASPMVNFIYDKAGSYIPAMRMLVGVSVLTITLYLLSFRGASRDRRRMEAEQGKSREEA